MPHPPITPTSFPLRRPPRSARVLPLAVIVLAAVTVLASFTMGFGLLGFSLVQPWARKPERARVEAPKPVMAPSADDPAGEIESIQLSLTQAETRAHQLHEAEEQASTRAALLKNEESQLTEVAEQRRRALLEAEDKSRRFTAEKQRTAERMQSLRAEAADLERRIAALRATLDAARRAGTGQAATQHLAPQLIECVRGGVILKPQQIRIASSDLGNGQLAALARQQGVYFLVEPTGLETFTAARNVARAAGVVVGYEPTRSGTEK